MAEVKHLAAIGHGLADTISWIPNHTACFSLSPPHSFAGSPTSETQQYAEGLVELSKHMKLQPASSHGSVWERHGHKYHTLVYPADHYEGVDCH